MVNKVKYRRKDKCESFKMVGKKLTYYMIVYAMHI